MNTKIVGILNITPDSFSDGGKFNLENQALTHLKKMLDDGADVIDIGAESTRPNAQTISADKEWSRLEKILPKIIFTVKNFNQKNNKNILLSLDSRHFTTIKKSCEIGVDIINDVSGLTDKNIIDLIAKNNITTILMHSLSVPANPDIIVNEELNVVDEILNWAKNKIEFLEKNGVKKSQLIFDPGIGFGKNSKQSIRILKNIKRLRELDLPIYIGHSKKRFLDEMFKDLIDEKNNLMDLRAQKTIKLSAYLASQDVDFIRVHDVLENKEAIQSSSSSFL